MNLFQHFEQQIVSVVEALIEEGALPGGLDSSRLSVEPPREAAHGDVTTNAAMVLAKLAGQKPHDLAEVIAARCKELEHVTGTEVAGPGFINLRLDAGFWVARLREILTAGPAYGDSTLGAGAPVNVEYVSANPTGPMHVGHGRGAVVGDALAGVLEKAGFAVTKEYYINDAGAQIEALARSLHFRYREALGETVGVLPEGLYPGEYLVPIAGGLARRDGAKWQNEPEEVWLKPLSDFAVAKMMDLIRDDLAAIGVKHDVFTSERTLVEAGAVEDVLAFLEGRDLVYNGVLEPPKGKTPEDWEPRPQTLFRATDFGDDVDRPLQKSDGSWTYFASDIAYHRDKFKRGFKTMIDVWGADHAGYVKRMQSAVKAVTEGQGALDVKVCRLVNLLEAGEPVKMSKRAGTFVTLREVVDRVGKDVLRFMMLTRTDDKPLDFDLAKVMEQSKDNPVFYVQYAHARIRSVFRHAAEVFDSGKLTSEALMTSDLSLLSDETELELIKLMAGWPRLVEQAALAHEPHRIAFYLNDLSALFHLLWNKGKDDTRLRFLSEADLDLSYARLALIQGVAFVIASGLNVFGVTPVEEMR
ncbi:MAG: arginine--tRNA ligase [Rhodospirillales bacterium]